MKSTRIRTLVDEIGTTRISEAIRTLGLEQMIRNFVPTELETLLGARGHGPRYGS